MGKVVFGAAVAASLFTSTAASGQAIILRTGLNDRISKLPGIEAQLDQHGNLKAGYYRVTIEDAGASNAAVCPRIKYKLVGAKAQEDWKSSKDKIYHEIFDKNVSWTLTGELAVDAPGIAEHFATTLRFASIKDAEDSTCEVSVGDPDKGVSWESFLIPINRNLHHFGDKVRLKLKVNYSNKADKGRIKNLWDGISYGVSAIVPGASAVLEAVAPKAEAEVDKLLDKSNAAETMLTLDYDPTSVAPNSYYIDLGFFHDKPVENQPGKSGIIVKVDYVATVFANGRFFAPIATPNSALLAKQVRTAGGFKDVASLFKANEYSELKNTASLDTFKATCTSALNGLVQSGLAESDAAIAVRSLGIENAALKTRLHEVDCLMQRNDLLKHVGMEIITPVEPVVVEKSKATQAAMHNTFELLGAALQTNNAGDAFTAGFADNVQLFVDDKGKAALGLQTNTVTLPRQQLVLTLANAMDRIGCFVPRLSRTEAIGMRPNLIVSSPTDFVGATAMKLKTPLADGTAVLVATYLANGFSPPATNQKISFISVTGANYANDDVRKDMTENRRPASCNEAWMDGLFN